MKQELENIISIQGNIQAERKHNDLSSHMIYDWKDISSHMIYAIGKNPKGKYTKRLLMAVIKSHVISTLSILERLQVLVSI